MSKGFMTHNLTKLCLVFQAINRRFIVIFQSYRKYFQIAPIKVEIFVFLCPEIHFSLDYTL